MTSPICPGCLENKVYLGPNSHWGRNQPPDDRRWYRFLLVTGSRSITDYEFIVKCLNDAMHMLKFTDVDYIICGDAKGVDHYVEVFCFLHKIFHRVYEADWKNNGKAAGVIRNGIMVKRATQGIAIWDGRSRGTLDCINKLRASKKLMKVYFYNKNER